MSSTIAHSIQALALVDGTATRLSRVDLSIVVVYLIAITLFGLRFREKKNGKPADKSLKSYFLANNTIPWWAIALSIVSAETSTLTIISIPGVAFAGNFGFLQLVIGYMLGRIVVAMLFLPRYFAGEMLTAYQLIDRRFGSVLHKVTAGLFLLTRAAAEGVRVFAVSIVVGIAIGTRDVLSIAIISALTLLYTFEGGMTAVIWTDVVQMFIYVAGTVVAILTLGSHVSGGWHTIHQVAGSAGKFHMLDFTLNLTSTYTFWAGVLGGTFLTMASHGTDQLMVQRMLAARNLRESRLALLSSGAVIFLQFTLFLLIGAGLYVFYGQHPTVFNSSDRIFPTFIVHEMPIGGAGLLVAAILAAAMSNLSAALNSLSSTTVVDFYMHLRPTADDRERGIVSKSSTVLWALVLFAIAAATVRVGGKGHVVEIGLSIASVAYGCLLGVFLLGTLTRYATEIGASIGMVCGFALNIWLWQGAFPVHIASLTIPRVAYPWYTIIGSIVTFIIGSLCSFIFRKQSTRRVITAAVTTAALLPMLFCLSLRSEAQESAARTTSTLSSRPKRSEVDRPAPGATQTPNFAQIDQLINDAIAAHKLPGAVVLIGHNGKVAYEHAYGNRKLAGEPGLDEKPSPAEPMTEDTIFDMASLTKDLATATAIMQLYEQGKITSFDDPIEKYLPEFNNAAEAERQHRAKYPPWVRADLRNKTPLPVGLGSIPDPVRSRVTVRMLLTHFSGEPPDISLKDSWGLAHPERTEGFFRAETAALAGPPGAKFVYSDINFILLGAIIERITGWPEDTYVAVHIYNPLQMKETRYLAFEKACGSSKDIPIPLRNEVLDMTRKNDPNVEVDCDNLSWTVRAYCERAAPTAHDDESKANTALNPDFDHLLRAVVHDPTTRRMGGVAGHAGLFSTAHDVSLFAQALLDKLTKNTGPFPLKQSTLQLMTQPEQPTAPGSPSVAPHARGGSGIAELTAANAAASAVGRSSSDPLLQAAYPAIKDQNLRGFGWDIDTAFSKPRGAIFPIGSFGHTGFTGTSLWMDPGSDTYVILLANAVHPRGGNGPISNLRGEVATAAAQAMELYASLQTHRSERSTAEPTDRASSQRHSALQRVSDPNADVRTGIDVLEQSNFLVLQKLTTEVQRANHMSGAIHLGLVTNQTGLDSQGRRTIDILQHSPIANAKLTTLFSPEHGISGRQDTTTIASGTDEASGLPVISLYGAHDADRRPTHVQLAALDVIVIDLQDAGVHFWTYESVLGYFLEAASTEESAYHHDVKVIVLDRPNPVGGVAYSGPTVEAAHTNYVGYMAGIPIRHGMTYGELAEFINAEKNLKANLAVVPMQHWQRAEFWSDTGLPWTPPSPNLRSPEAATLYPALGEIESTNLSVGRGTEHPFSFFGAGIPAFDKKANSQPAAWFKGAEVAAALTARHIPGVTFTATTEPIAEDANHYPFHGQTIEAVHVTCTDAPVLDTPELGVEILATLHKLYPAQFHVAGAMTILANKATMDALERGDDPRDIARSWQSSLDDFAAKRKRALLY